MNNINKIIDMAETLNNEVSMLKDSDMSIKDIKEFFGELPYPEIIVDIDNRLTLIVNWINGKKIEDTTSSVPTTTRTGKHPGGNWSHETRNAIIKHVVKYCNGMTVNKAAKKCIDDLGLYQSPIKLIAKKTYTKFTDGIFDIVNGKIKVIK